jgi:hypothetical protein
MNFYTNNAHRLFDQYRSLSLEVIHFTSSQYDLGINIGADRDTEFASCMQIDGMNRISFFMVM